MWICRERNFCAKESVNAKDPRREPAWQIWGRVKGQCGCGEVKEERSGENEGSWGWSLVEIEEKYYFCKSSLYISSIIQQTEMDDTHIASIDLTGFWYWSHLFKKLLKKKKSSLKRLTSAPLTDLSREIFLKITWFGAGLLAFILAAVLTVPGSFFHFWVYVRCYRAAER